MSLHQPVLVDEVISYLDVKQGEKFIDATYGSGGHTKEILKKGGVVLGLDVSHEAIQKSDQNSNLKLLQGNFSRIYDLATQADFVNVAGVLFDFGVSSDELINIPGLSFQKDEFLDMRLDQDLGVTAADLLNALPEPKLDELFKSYGEEPYSRAVAKAVVGKRVLEPIKSSFQLVEIVESIKGRRRPGSIHPATQVFQALRIAVNGELEAIKEALPQAVELLKPGGRLVTISFHSGEDRIVKEFIKGSNLSQLTKKPIQPQPSEIISNPRSRSAKLRAAEKS